MAATTVFFLSLLTSVSCSLFYVYPYPSSIGLCKLYPANAMRDACCFKNQPLYGKPDGFCLLNGADYRTVCPDNMIFNGIISSKDTGSAFIYGVDQSCLGDYYQIVYQCCPCPYEPLISTAPWPNDDPKARCVGCSGTGEILKGTSQTGFSCSIPSKPSTTKPAPTPTSVPNGKCKTDDLGITTLLERERFRATFYTLKDGKDGKDQTIGYGHDCTQNKDCASFHPPITKAQALAQFKKDLVSREVCVGGLPNAKLINSNQFAALVSFTFNSGCSWTKHYFAEKTRVKDFKGIAAVLPRTHIGSGPNKQGLINRRMEEQKLFNTPTNVMSGC